MNQKDMSKNQLKPKAPFKWVFMNIIPSTSSNSLTSDTTFYNGLLIVDAYYKTPKMYVVEKTTADEVMDNMDIL